jgi:hypothetical protein
MARITTPHDGQEHLLTLTVGRKGKAGFGRVKGGMA